MVLQVPELPHRPASSWPEPLTPRPPARRIPLPVPEPVSDPGAAIGRRATVRERSAPYTASVAPVPTRLSAGLCRLLNAAVIYPTLRAVFLTAPLEAAALATRDQGVLIDHQLPDPSLRLPPIVLEEGDWAVLRRLEPSDTLAAAASKLITLVTSRALEQGDG